MTQEIKLDITNEIVVGPIVSNSDGLTPVNNLTLTGADEKALIKHGGTSAVSISTNSWLAITSADGYYNLFLTAGQCDTAGNARVVIADDSVCLPRTEYLNIITSAQWYRKYGAGYTALESSVSSLHTRVSSVSVRVSSVQAMVNSANTRVMTLPNSQTLNAHIITLPTSTTFSTLPNSSVLNGHITTLPTSEVVHAEILTLPTSQTLNAHIITLPNSEVLSNVSDQVSSLDVRVTSLDIEVGSINVEVGSLGTLANQTTIISNVDSLDARVTSIDSLIDTLPNSQTLNGHVLTLPTSQALNAHIITLATSETLQGMINTLPNSEALNAHILTLPTSEEINGYMVTLPTSSMVELLDRQVSSLFYTEIESGYSFLAKQKIDMSIFAGVTSGGGTTTLHFRDVGDTKSRLIVTVDSNQNRTSVNTLDGS